MSNSDESLANANPRFEISEIGGRDVVAFVTVEHDQKLVSVQPIPADGVNEWRFSGDVSPSTGLSVWGVETLMGQRIAAKYDSGDLPADVVSWEDIHD